MPHHCLLAFEADSANRYDARVKAGSRNYELYQVVVTIKSSKRKLQSSHALVPGFRVEIVRESYVCDIPAPESITEC